MTRKDDIRQPCAADIVLMNLPSMRDGCIRRWHALHSVPISTPGRTNKTKPRFNATGYAWVGVCVLSTATFLILIRTLGKELELNQHALLFYNNLLSLPMMLAWFLLATDEPKSVFSAYQWQDPSFLVFLLVSASQAFLLNACTFWCTTVNSALVTTIVGECVEVSLFLGRFGFSIILGFNPPCSLYTITSDVLHP